MNIRDINGRTGRPDLSPTGAAVPVRPTDTQATKTETGRTEQRADVNDRVELSGQTPATTASSPEISAARKELLGFPPLSPDRAADILKRIQEGYYSQPEVVKVVAEQVAQNFAGASPSDAAALGQPAQDPGTDASASV